MCWKTVHDAAGGRVGLWRSPAGVVQGTALLRCMLETVHDGLMLLGEVWFVAVFHDSTPPCNHDARVPEMCRHQAHEAPVLKPEGLKKYSNAPRGPRKTKSKRATTDNLLVLYRL